MISSTPTVVDLLQVIKLKPEIKYINKNKNTNNNTNMINMSSWVIQAPSTAHTTNIKEILLLL